MKQESSEPVSNLLDHRATFWSVIALAFILFTLTNLPWHLDEYDQAKQAFTSLEMVNQGHWIYQHTPNGWVATKPPLVGWISAFLFAATRSWELAWRLPSFLATLALLFLIARAAAVYCSAAAVLVATSAFSLNLFTPRLATLVRTDMPLALILFVIGWLIWEKIRKRETWNTTDRLWMFLLLSGGMLIKGPIIYAFLLPPIVALTWRVRAKGETASAWFGWWPWLASLGIFLAWVTGGVLFVPEFSEHVVMREFAGRFSADVHRSQPIYFYLPHLLHRFAPWSILLILLPLLAVKKQSLGIGAGLRMMSPETFWLIAWSLGGLLVMSFVPSKRTDRIFPIVPPFCLLLAFLVSEFRIRERLKGATEMGCAITLVIACLFTTGYAAGRIVTGYREGSDAFAKFGYAVRKEAAAHRWHYKVVGGDDEGMLLYVRQTEFLEPDQAAIEWNNGKLDGLIFPEDELSEWLPCLPGAVASSQIGYSGPAGRYKRRYLFLLRS